MAGEVHKFRYRRDRMARDADPSKVNDCAECGGNAIDPQHGGQFCSGFRIVQVDNVFGVAGACGWCDWQGKPKIGGGVNWNYAMANRDSQRHIDKVHANRPPQTAVYAGELPTE